MPPPRKLHKVNSLHTWHVVAWKDVNNETELIVASHLMW